MPIVSYLGPETSYTHQVYSPASSLSTSLAVRSLEPEISPNTTPRPLSLPFPGAVPSTPPRNTLVASGLSNEACSSPSSAHSVDPDSFDSSPPPPYTLVDDTKLAWAYGLTDYDLVQAAMGAFEGEKYDYRAVGGIPGLFTFCLSSGGVEDEKGWS